MWPQACSDSSKSPCLCIASDSSGVTTCHRSASFASGCGPAARSLVLCRGALEQNDIRAVALQPWVAIAAGKEGMCGGFDSVGIGGESRGEEGRGGR